MFKILTVAEDNGQSDRMTAVQSQHNWMPGWPAAKHEISFTVTVKRDIQIEERRDGKLINSIQYPRVDLDSLILFLQDVQTFISEEEMIEMLKGKK